MAAAVGQSVDQMFDSIAIRTAVMIAPTYFTERPGIDGVVRPAMGCIWKQCLRLGYFQSCMGCMMDWLLDCMLIRLAYWTDSI